MVRISVIVPVRNGQAYLAESLESVLANGPDEVLVVDDGSTDATPQIAQSYAGVRYIAQAATGACQARNRGLALATGDWIAFQDADDVWSSDKLARQTALLQAEPELDGVFGWVRQFASPELSAEQRRALAFDARPQPAWMLGCLLARRQLFEKVGPFDTRYQLGEFIDWCLRSQEAGCRYGSVPEVVLERRIHRSNLGRTQRDCRQDYARIVMAAFQRRKQSAPLATRPASGGDSGCAASD